MTINDIVFWASSAVSIITTIMILTSKNPFYAVLYLIMSLFGLSMIFYTLGAQFLAVLEIIVYAGAIMVLFLFVVQMLSPGMRAETPEGVKRPSIKQAIIPSVLALTLIGCTVYAILQSISPDANIAVAAIDTKTLTRTLYEKHYLGVKLASLILLIGTIGGMHLGRAVSDEGSESEEGPNALR